MMRSRVSKRLQRQECAIIGCRKNRALIGITRQYCHYHAFDSNRQSRNRAKTCNLVSIKESNEEDKFCHQMPSWRRNVVDDFDRIENLLQLI
eukprot:TRINITY_DN4593_c0_g1_i1.p1 TRINITY_DN4593_c0_g1~~TRINITY_DN4593_c0_g1_i1.p1  ORF type:complete len:92 (+),score=5.91 TRINITY_DN4593_c0_g1_i1:101-376(+)